MAASAKIIPTSISTMATHVGLFTMLIMCHLTNINPSAEAGIVARVYRVDHNSVQPLGVIVKTDDDIEEEEDLNDVISPQFDLMDQEDGLADEEEDQPELDQEDYYFPEVVPVKRGGVFKRTGGALMVNRRAYGRMGGPITLGRKRK